MRSLLWISAGTLGLCAQLAWAQQFGAELSQRTAGKWSRPPVSALDRTADATNRKLAEATQEFLDLFEDDALRSVLEEASPIVRYDGGRTYAIELEAKDLLLPETARQDVAAYGLPDTIDAAEIFITVVIDSSLAQTSTGATPRRIDVETADLIWGDVQIGVTGQASFDSQGLPTGTFSVSTPDLPGLFALLDQDDHGTANLNLLGRLIGRNNGAETTLDLSIRDGLISVYGFPIAKIPPLVIP